MADENNSGSPGEQIAAEMVKQMALLNVNAERLAPMMGQNVDSVDELAGYFECFARAMAVLGDRKRGSRAKKLSLDDFVEAWEIAAEETWPDEGGDGGSSDDDDDPDGDDGDDPGVLEPEPVGGGDRRV